MPVKDISSRSPFRNYGHDYFLERYRVGLTPPIFSIYFKALLLRFVFSKISQWSTTTVLELLIPDYTLKIIFHNCSAVLLTSFVMFNATPDQSAFCSYKRKCLTHKILVLWTHVWFLQLLSRNSISLCRYECIECTHLYSEVQRKIKQWFYCVEWQRQLQPCQDKGT